ncbi:alpha-1D adrenergic receptor-like [Diadema antillarum]|uniref:alpha-1D adrenergic receptor-like n=1 Tax=Diadema antillarum TaxID=105358 RepID=UPI003A8A6F64
MANMSANTSAEIGRAQTVVAGCIFSTTILLGTFGNILVLASVALSRQLRTSTNIFVVGLAVTDLLNCLLLIVQVLSLLNVSESDSFGVVCTVAAIGLYIFLGISVATLALIAVDRFFMITKTREEYMAVYTKRNIAIMMVTLYGAISMVTLAFAMSGVATFGRYEGICAHATGESYSFLGGAWLLLSLIAIVTSYVRIYAHVRNHLRKLTAASKQHSLPDPGVAGTASQEESDQTKEACSTLKMAKPAGFAKRQRDIESKITVNMLVIIVLFFLCVSPSIFTLVLPGDQEQSAIIIAIITLNSGLNPLVYAWKHPIFRHAFKCILRLRWSEINEPSHSVHVNCRT